MADITLTKISDHNRTKRPGENGAGFTIGKTTAGHSQWTLVWGEGSDRQSRTMHCSAQEAEAEKSKLKA